MQRILEQNRIDYNESLKTSLLLLLMISTFSTQSFLLTNKVNSAEYIIKPNINTNFILKREQKKSPPKPQVDIAQESQKWEAGVINRYKYGRIKTIDEGIKHITLTKYIKNRPVKINVVEVNRTINPNINISPALAKQDNLSSKSGIKKIAQESNSIVAINGSFFKPQNGIPLGSLMIDGKLLTGPMYNRVAMGIFDDGMKIERVELNATAENENYSLKIDNINQPRMLSTYVLIYTREWGEYAPPSPQYGMQVAIKDGKIIEFSTNRLQIPDNGYVIVGPKEKLLELSAQKTIEIKLNTNPNWDGVKHIISGGPYLVKNGEIYVDVTEQKLNSITGRNPRTAIGITEDKNLVLITVDGREESSVGMTLTELANFMKEIGCIEAMNLDGGGSSVMYVAGNIVNNPSIKGGIAISNAFTVSVNQERISMGEEK